MTSYLTRDLQITYGAFVVGGSTDRHLHDSMTIVENLADGSVSFQIWIQKDDDSDFETEVAAVRAAFRARDNRLQIENITASTTLLDWNPAAGATGNSAFNIRSEITKAGTEQADTANSRLYDVTLTAEFPADQESGQRELEVDIDWSNSNRRTVTISGAYTALTTRDATAQYENQIAAEMSSITSAIDGSAAWEYIERSTKRDRTDKVIRFRWVWVERLANQASDILDHASIRDSFLRWQWHRDSPGDTAVGLRRLERLTAIFTCAVDKDVTLDLKATYEDVVLPFIAETLVEEFGPQSFGLEVEDRVLDEDDNRISCTLTYLVAIDATDVVASTISTRIVEEGGIHYSQSWSGGVFDSYADQGHATRHRHSIREVEVLGVLKPKERIGGSGGSFQGADFSDGHERLDGGGSRSTSGGFFDSLTQSGRERAAGGGGGISPGWNIVANDSHPTVVRTGIGEDQIVRTVLIERVIERWHDTPGSGS